MTSHSTITLSDTVATRLSPNGTHSGIDFTIQNVNESGYVYIGSSEVTDTYYGYRILPNHAISIELSARDAIYAVSSEDGMEVAVLQTNLESGS